MRVPALLLALASLALGCVGQAPVGADPVDEGGEGEGNDGGDVGDGEGEGEAGEGEGDDDGGSIGNEGGGLGPDGEGEGEGEGGDEGEGEGPVVACGPVAALGDVPGCSVDAAGDPRCVINHGGRERSFIVHVPDNLSTPSSLVLSFHGLRTTARLQRNISRMNDTADRDGFVVVYPEGIGMSWNSGACCGEAASADVDDVGFSVAVVDWLAERLCISRDRVFATGLSNGGHMAYKLACDRADVFAAVAPVAGVVATACAPVRPVPVLHFHGTADSIVSYNVGISGVGAEATVARWGERNGCSTTSEVTFREGDVTCRAFTSCREGASVELCSVSAGGHQWPGGTSIPLLGYNTDDVVASDRIAAFFAAHAMP